MQGAVITAAKRSIFECHLSAGPHSVEVLGYDGLDVSPHSVDVGYIIRPKAQVEDEEGQPTEAEGEDKAMNVSPVALAGIVMGAVAVVDLAIVGFIVARRRRQVSSSEGLIEND
jgi:hypothetical protein